MTAANREGFQKDRGSTDCAPNLTDLGDSVEALLRHVAVLRAANSGDDQLVQLIRIVDSGGWSAPVPMTVLVDGTLVRGQLVPGEVSATYFDDALQQSAETAVSHLESRSAEPAEEKPGRISQPSTESESLIRARAFLRRVRRNPFSVLQAAVRKRNANALVAINDWRKTREPNSNLTPLDFPGHYSDPNSPVRDVLSYTVGQRALTLADVKILVSGEWITFSSPMRILLGRIGAWTTDT
jgi:hypothetical protein